MNLRLILWKGTTDMPILFLCFIIFAIWLRVKLKRPGDENESTEKFWERENAANFSRSRDISQLDYISVKENALPYAESPEDERERDLQAEVKRAAARKMLNLSAFSNTDLKEKYGVANLDLLSEYDQNFLVFIRSLSQWGSYLYEKEDLSRAKQIMEYSLCIGSDISSVYTVLGHIYAKEGETKKVDELIQTVEESDFSLKNSMLKQLRLCRLEP